MCLIRSIEQDITVQLHFCDVFDMYFRMCKPMLYFQDYLHHGIFGHLRRFKLAAVPLNMDRYMLFRYCDPGVHLSDIIVSSCQGELTDVAANNTGWSSTAELC